MKRLWKEIKEAFPFFWCKRIDNIVYTPYEMSNRILKINISIKMPSTRDRLESILDEIFPRYTVKTYRDIKKAGIVELFLPIFKENSFKDIYLTRALRNGMPVAILFEFYKLPFYKNLWNKKQWIEED